MEKSTFEGDYMITTSTMLKEVIGTKRKKRKRNYGLEGLRAFKKLEKRWNRIYAKAKISRG
jgi:hypothetical protein